MIQSEVSWIKLAPVILIDTRQAQVKFTNWSVHRKHIRMTGAHVPGTCYYLMANGKEREVFADGGKSPHPHRSVRPALG